MPIIINDNQNPLAPKILDDRYGPYTGLTQANNAILPLYRVVGLTVGILEGNQTFDGGRYTTSSSGITEYWYYTGITDSDLVLKTSGSGGGGGPFNLDNEDILVFSSITNTLATKYNTQIADTVNSVPVGGALATPASEWKQLNMVEVLDKILFPKVYATYTIPTLFLTGQQGIKEIGEAINQTLSLKGVKNDAGDFTDLAISKNGTSLSVTSISESLEPDLLPQFGYPNTNNPNKGFTVTASDSFSIDTPAPGETSKVYTYIGTSVYDQGNKLDDNKGTLDDRGYAVRSNQPQDASNTLTTQKVITGIYPYYYGVTDTLPSTNLIQNMIDNGTASKVLSSAQGNITLVLNMSQPRWLWYAQFAEYPAKTQWFVSESNKGGIGPNQLFNSPITANLNSGQLLWAGKSFAIYIFAYQTQIQNQITIGNNLFS